MESKVVTVKIMGKSAQVIEDFQGSTVKDLKDLMGLEGNYTVNIGGSPASDDTQLSNGAYVVLAPSVKGAMAKKPVKPVAKPTKKPVKRK